MTKLTLDKPALEDNNDAISIATTLVKSKLRRSGDERANFATVRESVNEAIELLGVWVDDHAVLKEVARRNSITVRFHMGMVDEVAFTYNDLT